MSHSSFSIGLYRPYLQPMSGLGQSGRTLSSVICGGPRAGAGSMIRVYNFYRSQPEAMQTKFLTNLRNNSSRLIKGVNTATGK